MIFLGTHLLLSLTILNVIYFTFRFFMNNRPSLLVHIVGFMLNTAFYLVCLHYLMTKMACFTFLDGFTFVWIFSRID